jgi:hypothetical protein
VIQTAAERPTTLRRTAQELGVLRSGLGPTGSTHVENCALSRERGQLPRERRDLVVVIAAQLLESMPTRKAVKR